MKISVIGLGLIGGNIAKCLIQKGYEAAVFDTDCAKLNEFSGKAMLCQSAAEAGANSDIILLSLPNSEIVESTVEALLESGISGKIILDLSTSYPLSTKALAAKCEKAGAALLDAPLLAGPDEALAGTLTMMIAGCEEKVKEADSLLKDFTSHYDYVGESGNAHLMKILMNFTGLMYTVILGQMFPIAEKAGLDPMQLYHIMDNDIFSTWMYRFYAPKMIDRSFDMAFSLKLGLKDLTYMKRLYEAYNVPAFALDGALDLLRTGMKDGKGDEDFSRVAQTMYEYLKLPTEPEAAK